MGDGAKCVSVESETQARDAKRPPRRQASNRISGNDEPPTHEASKQGRNDTRHEPHRKNGKHDRKSTPSHGDPPRTEYQATGRMGREDDEPQTAPPSDKQDGARERMTRRADDETNDDEP